MKGYVCGVCGYVSIDGIAPEFCPVCHVPKDKFVEKENAIKLPQERTKLSELEKKHIPQITIVKKCGLIPEGCRDVHARIGEIIHPMQQEHLIMAIDFYHDKKFLSRVILTPEKPNPAAALHLKVDSGTITVISHCNVHGNWINEVSL